MGRFKASLEIFQSSWNVLKADKELAFIPLISFGCTVAAMALIGVAGYFSLEVSDVVSRTVDEATSTSPGTSLSVTPLTYVIGFFGYLLVTFVVTFFTAALVSGAYQRLTGSDPTVASALSGAVACIGSILKWSILAGTIGYVLRALEERAGILGRIVINLIGMAWQVVTWLAIPIIVIERTGAVDALKRSSTLFRSTWGENLIAQAGFGVVTLLIMTPTIVIVALLVPLAPIFGIVVGVIAIGGFSVLLSTLNGIFRTVLYIYAATGDVVPGFSRESLTASFGPRKRMFT